MEQTTNNHEINLLKLVTIITVWKQCLEFSAPQFKTEFEFNHLCDLTRSQLQLSN